MLIGEYMNTTELRDATFLRLADPSTGGIYSAAQVDAALDDALATVAPSFPVDRELTPAVAADALELAGDPLYAHATRVFLPSGQQIPRFAGDLVLDPSPYAPLVWFTRRDTIQLSRPVQDSEAGTWSIDAWTIPSRPASDTEAWELPEQLAGAITALAAAELIRARLITDARRGHRVDYAVRTLADDLHREAQRILDAHKRRARGGTL